MVRSPVEICLGTSPSHAAKSRPLEKLSPVPIAATMALEMIGPMPGTLIRRSHRGAGAEKGAKLFYRDGATQPGCNEGTTT